MVEYAVNFDTSSSDDAHSFERMLRRLLKLPTAPAILLLNTMELMHQQEPGLIDFSKIFFSGCTSYGCREAHPWATEDDLRFTWAAPAEDAIVALAQYYAVPCVSLRGALFSEFKHNTSRFPMKQVKMP